MNRLESVAAPARSGILSERDLLEVRFGGSGGQGIILMGVILAMAATHDRRQVVQTQSYGPEARGGYSRSDVIISDEPIDYPQASKLDMLVVLNQKAADVYTGFLRPDGLLIYDSEEILKLPKVINLSYGIPFSKLAKEEIGRIQTTNVLALGAVVGITGVVSRSAVRKAMLEMVPKGTKEINSKALTLGLSLDPGDWLNLVP